MNIIKAQQDMKHAYYGGGPGMLVSGLVWLLAGLLAWQVSAMAGVLAFFIGGMFIFPLGMLFSKILKRPGKHAQDNPLSALALESTMLLFAGLFIAYVVMLVQMNWFFPVMLMVVGVRYLIFQTLYGMRAYWLIGAVMAFTGMFSIILNAPFVWGALIGSLIELIGATWLMVLAKQTKQQPSKHS